MKNPKTCSKPPRPIKTLGRLKRPTNNLITMVQTAQTPRPLVINSYLELARMAVIKKEIKAAVDYFLKVLEIGT